MQTGADSIAAALPPVCGSAPGQYQTISSSGHSTSNAFAPKTITAFPENTFQLCLQSAALQKALLVQLHIVETESSHKLDTEGDIERAAAIYLVHDVNLIIEKGLLPLLACPNIPVQFHCLGQSTTGLSRPDIKFVVNNKTVLILEYKRA